AGLTAAFMPQIGKIGSDVGRVVVTAIVGGTISELTGGKFANGAVTGAIMAMLVGRSESSKRQQGRAERGRAETTISKIWKGVKAWVLGPDPLTDAGILGSMQSAFEDAEPFVIRRRHEEGGYWGTEADGSLGSRRWPSGSRFGDPSITAPKLGADGLYKGLLVRGEFHVHPWPVIDEYGRRWIYGPGSSDMANMNRNIPGPNFIIDHTSVHRYDALNPHGQVVGTRCEILGC
ncbi:MAG: hypothetical protein ACREPE_13535, partial [Lysobacter sp.]